nr:fatty acid binding protein adipocyte [Hymenolepis microstoma]
MERFLGAWKVESNEDFHKFLNHFGVPSPLARLVVSFGSTTEFSRINEDTYEIKISSVKGKTQATFKLGEEFDEKSSGDTTLKSKITIDNGVMKHVQCGSDESIITTRTIDGELMTAVYNVGDLTCSRIYKRCRK